MMNKEITFIIPCYNEHEDVLTETVQGLKVSLQNTAIDRYEIIIVNDGSDEFNYVPEPEEFIKVLHHPVNRGYGASLKTGIKQAEHEWIAITDADGTYPNESFDELIQFIPKYDMVIGARQWKDISLIRRFPKRILTFFAGFLSGVPIPDLNSGMRVFRKDLAKKFWHLYPDGFSFTSTITMASITNDYKLKFHDIGYSKRIGQSTIHPVKDTLRFFSLVTRLALYFNPKKFFIPLSLVLAILALLRGGRDYVVEGSLGGVTLLLFFMAFQVFFFGLLAEIINKTRLFLSAQKNSIG